MIVSRYKFTFMLFLFCLASVSLGTVSGLGKEPGASEWARIAIYPPEVHLSGQRDAQKFVVVAVRDDDVTKDVTADAQISIRDPQMANLEGNQLTPALLVRQKSR